MEQHDAIRGRLSEQARDTYGRERAATLSATLDRLAAAIATVAAFPVALACEPFPTGPVAEGEQA